jgi:hypothetical protein
VSDAWSPHSYAPHNNQTEDTMGAPHSAGHTPTDGRSNPSPPPAAGQKSATVTRGLSEDACPHQGGGVGGGETSVRTWQSGLSTTVRRPVAAAVLSPWMAVSMVRRIGDTTSSSVRTRTQAEWSEVPQERTCADR